MTKVAQLLSLLMLSSMVTGCMWWEDEEVIEEEDIETGELVEHSTGNKAIFLTEGEEPETNRYNFI